VHRGDAAALDYAAALETQFARRRRRICAGMVLTVGVRVLDSVYRILAHPDASDNRYFPNHDPTCGDLGAGRSPRFRSTSDETLPPPPTTRSDTQVG
jgi:hypothetical protein